MAKIALVSDKTLILGTRDAYIQPFTAPSWTDLRVGMWLSVTKSTADDDATGLAEILSTTTAADRLWIGLKNNGDDNKPTAGGTSFQGLSSVASTVAYLSASPITVRSNGVSQTIDVYRYNGATATNFLGGIPSASLFASGLYFPPFPGWDGYAVFLGIRYFGTGQISVTGSGLMNSAAHTTSTPTVSSLRGLLRNLTGWQPSNTNSTAISPDTDAIYFYWPFLNSRLRIHALVIEKFA
jgi:hypothetical protein